MKTEPDKPNGKTDREQVIDARAKQKGITRAAAAQEIDRESAAAKEAAAKAKEGAQ